MQPETKEVLDTEIKGFFMLVSVSFLESTLL